MRDVAEHAGVSQTTVSLVLNNPPGNGIPEATRHRVLESIEAVGYRTNRLARAMRLNRTDTIGFVSDDVATTPFASRMIRGAQDAAWEAGRLLLIVNTGSFDDELHDAHQRLAIDQLLERQVDGIVLASMFHRTIEAPQALGEVPSVLLDASSDNPSLSSAVPDSKTAARLATEYLIDAGHRRIAHATNVFVAAAGPLRIQGYEEALRGASIEPDPALLVSAVSDQAGGRAAAAELFALDDPPTAIFCFNDRMAMGVYQAAAEAGLRIPDDLSVIGFDDQELIAADLVPGLTTMALPHYEMGRWAVTKLLSPDAEPEQIELPCPLVERGSVAAPRWSQRLPR